MPRTPAKRIKPSAPDRDNPVWGVKEFGRAKPAADVLPTAVASALGARRRGPQATPTKEAVSIRLDRDVLDTLRASGPGWQGRVNDALRQALALGNRRLAEPRKVS
jgi:uncharacterized protein (DUF4415 family)